MKPFTLHDLNDDAESQANKPSTFINYFEEKNEEIIVEEKKEETKPASLEDQARAVFEDAFVQGEKAGYEMGLKKVDPLVKRLTNYLSELSVFTEELVERSKRMATELALVFAEAIILKECSERRETITVMAKKALDLCEEKNDILIRMRKEDAELIAPEEVSHLRIVKDDTLKEPGFIIETNFGDIDGRISIQIEELKKRFLDGHLD